MKKILLIFILFFTGCSIQKNRTEICLKESFSLDQFLKDERYWGDKTKINEVFTLKEKCLYEIEERKYLDENKEKFSMATFHIYDYSKRQKLASYNVGLCFGEEGNEACEINSNEYFELKLRIQEEAIKNTK